ncbi:MAG TPA: hypothetical protein VFM65_10075 [Flavobacteriaceae bacterium]|nr:hypothetical protein [Flavobacteriaceae bacterium]
MKKFRGKYRTDSHRLSGWDYSRNGYYYVTIVAYGRKYIFGNIKNKKMIFSDFGKIVFDQWYKSFEIRQELFLDEFILMPNHLHAIVVLRNREIPENDNAVDDSVDDSVETYGRMSLHSQKHSQNDPQYSQKHSQNDPQHSQNQTENSQNSGSSQKYIPVRKPKSISSFIGGFKSRTITKIDDFIDDNGLTIEKYNRQNPLWQANYHDHIIRNDKSYHKIKNYIINNPANWDTDMFN